MRTSPTNTVIVVGGALALLLLIAAIWATDTSTPTQLALTGILIGIAVAIFAGAAPRRPGETLPHKADAEQRKRMRNQVP